MEQTYSMGYNYGMQELFPQHKIYNSCFYPNVCHVCKLRDNNHLILCSRCGMISYCSETHQWQHLPQHKDLCAAIVKVFSHNAEQRNGEVDLCRFQRSKFSMMNSVKRILSRNLYRYEEQMFMFEKSCLICNRRDNLYTCQSCFVSNYCDNHKNEFYMIHNNCNKLRLCLDLDTYIVDKEWHLCFTVPEVQNFPNKDIPIVNMDDFLFKYVKRGLITQHCFVDLYSDWISGPLTLYNGLKETYLLPKLTNIIYTIHIINPDYIDRVNFLMWELLLHISPFIKELRIVMLIPMIRSMKVNCDICSHCRKDKKLLFECYPMLYQDYVGSSQYKKPNVIVVFQENSDCFKDWVGVLNVIKNQNCPLFLTTKSFSKAEGVASNIKRILRLSVLPVRIIENRFCSTRPHRDVLHSTFYRNKYLICFETLNVPAPLFPMRAYYVKCCL
ncbi:uncharacterized protein LOC116843071 [Odontomachus brunneus]|uniref:uncharacterized protein LOC116843071 n=1 Tax=Odontomachus brunneus TaxID=486640 RepID=UPI0013F219E0|nr:uncharacterized protein LOC116843071 [Odontomachus brunneus]